MSRVALMTYHKNISKIYPPSWIYQYRDSILGQTHKDFDIYEICYGGEPERIFEKSTYLNREFPTFNHAQQFLLEFLFDDGYDCVANSNVDDAYDVRWLETMLPWIKKGYDIVSCNFILFQDVEMLKKHEFHNLNIEEELNKNHNILCHPAILYSKKFWERGHRYAPEDVKTSDEDMKLWQRAIKDKELKFIILPQHLCYHRIHNNSVCQSSNK